MSTSAVLEFQRAFEAVRGVAHVVPDAAAAATRVVEIIREAGGSSVALAQLPEDLMSGMGDACTAAGIDCKRPPYDPDSLPAALDEPDFGITGMDSGIAESGTLVEIATDDAVRLASSLPDSHIGIVYASTLVPRLVDAAPRLREIFEAHPKNVTVTFISGPSRTGDIELILTLGVHGPEAAHAIIIEDIA